MSSVLCISSSSPQIHPGVSDSVKGDKMDLVDFVILRAFSYQRSGLGQDLAELCFCLCFRCLINYQAAVHSDFSPKNGLIPLF